MRTFVVRVYGPEQKTPPERRCLTGIVEEISTGVQAMFYDAEELVAILDRPLPELPAVTSPAAERPGAISPSGADIPVSAQPHHNQETNDQ